MVHLFYSELGLVLIIKEGETLGIPLGRLPEGELEGD